MPCNDECYEVHAAEDLKKDDYVTIDRDGGVRAVRGAHAALMDVYENFEFGVGAEVWKPKGYPFEGTVVSAFRTIGGDRRYVVESKLSPQLLHIFNANQLESV